MIVNLKIIPDSECITGINDNSENLKVVKSKVLYNDDCRMVTYCHCNGCYLIRHIICLSILDHSKTIRFIVVAHNLINV